MDEVQEVDFYLKNSKEYDVKFINTFIERDSNNLYLKGMKAYVLILNKEYSEAYKLINSLLSKNLNSTYIFMSAGVLEANKGNKILANKYFKKSLDLDIPQKNKWVRYELYHFLKDENEPLAWKYLEEAIAIDPSFTPALITKSYNLDQIDNCSEIIELLEKVIKDYSNDEDIFVQLGTAYYNCHNIDQAELYLNKSINLKANSDAYFMLGYLEQYESNNYSKALQYYNKSISLKPSNTEVLNSLGWLYLDNNDLVQAEAAFKQMLRYDSSQEIYNQLIQFYIYSKQLEKAKSYITEALQLNGRSSYVEGFNLVVEIIENPVWNENYSKRIKEFENKYEEYEIQWLNDIIKNINN